MKMKSLGFMLVFVFAFWGKLSAKKYYFNFEFTKSQIDSYSILPPVAFVFANTPSSTELDTSFSKKVKNYSNLKTKGMLGRKYVLNWEESEAVLAEKELLDFLVLLDTVSKKTKEIKVPEILMPMVARATNRYSLMVFFRGGFVAGTEPKDQYAGLFIGGVFMFYSNSAMSGMTLVIFDKTINSVVFFDNKRSHSDPRTTDFLDQCFLSMFKPIYYK